MEFSGTFELEDTTVAEVWLALSDPVMIESALPGCQFLVEVDTDDPDFDQLQQESEEAEDREMTADPEIIESRAFEEGRMYAALLQLSVGSVSPTFRTVVTIDEREKPRMEASGEGSASSSSFEMRSWMELSETQDGGVSVDWNSEADVFGRIAQMGQRVINPVANRVIKRFFSDIQSQIQELALAAEKEATRAQGKTEPQTETEADEAATETGDAGDSGSAVATGSNDGSTTDDGSSGGIIARIKRLLGIGG
jgi:carbon monoxide dehydrogenase subunit G